jgi:hypothetical protein
LLLNGIIKTCVVCYGKMDNNIVVYRSGKVKRGNQEIELKEVEVVNRTGNFFDNSGCAIENAWDVTKAVGNAAKKVGKKAKDVVNNDDKQ